MHVKLTQQCKSTILQFKKKKALHFKNKWSAIPTFLKLLLELLKKKNLINNNNNACGLNEKVDWDLR